MILTRESTVTQLKDQLLHRDKVAIRDLITQLETVAKMTSSLQKKSEHERNDTINGFFDEFVNPIAYKLWNTALAEHTSIQFPFSFSKQAFYANNGAVYDEPLDDDRFITLDELRELIQ